MMAGRWGTSAQTVIFFVAVGALSLGACKRKNSNEAAAPSAPMAPGATLSANWRTDARAYRGQVGTVVNVICPPGGPGGTVWGSDIYSDDSSVCAAALHSGRVSPATGGAFQIQILPGQANYMATLRNGVTTRPFRSYPGSFSIVGGPLPGLQAMIPQPLQAPPPVVGNGMPQGGVQTFSWSDSATRFRGQNGQTIRGFCPPGGAGGTVWGTGLYTDDSSICRAAQHAGRIGPGGGMFTLRILPGMPAYAGSNANGVNTSNYGSYPGSFSVQP